MKKLLSVSALALMASAGSIYGQTLNLFLTARTDDIENGVTDIAGGTMGSPIAVPAVGSRTVRIELRYSLTPSSSANTTGVISGLTSANINIISSQAVNGTASLGNLTGYQAFGGSEGTAANARFARLYNPDTTYWQDGAGPNAADYYGMHNPFRGGFAVTGNNADPGNGDFLTSPGNILGVTPVNITDARQRPGSANGQNNLWGIYTFLYTFEDGANGLISLTADAVADSVTGNSFAYFVNGGAVPVNGSQKVAGQIWFQVEAIPAPASAALLGLGGLVAARRRRA